jgi:hypothetical protein
MKTMQLPLDFQDGIYGACSHILTLVYKHCAPMELEDNPTLKGFAALGTKDT